MTDTNLTTPEFANAIPRWEKATWEDYVAYRDGANLDEVQLFFNGGYLFVDRGNEGINHSKATNLFTMIFAGWFLKNGKTAFYSLSRCLMEKPNYQAASPDKVLYIGEDSPISQPGEPASIDLDKLRVPNLVAEVADRTLATDLDEKKALYAALGIPEYWVIDIRGMRVFAFRLQDNGKYQKCDESVALPGLPISLLEETLKRLESESHGSAASWFSQQISN